MLREAAGRGTKDAVSDAYQDSESKQPDNRSEEREPTEAEPWPRVIANQRRTRI